MPSEEEIADQQTRLATYRRTLALYLIQQAILGRAFIPPGIDQGIREACTGIRRIKGILRAWGTSIDDHPDDEADQQLSEPDQARNHERLLREAGEAFKQGQQTSAIGILEAIERAVGGDLGRQVGLLRNLFIALKVPALPRIDKVLRDSLQLWEHYDEDAREVVVPALEWVREQPDGLDFLREHFSAPGSQRRRLLRDSRLKDIAPHLVRPQYQWPQHRTSVVNDPDVAQWLEKNGLIYNPFGSGAIELDPPLLGSRAHPDQWLSIMERKSTLIRGSTQQDCASVALFLHHLLQFTEPQSIFPVALVLPLANNREQSHGFDIVRAIVQIVGETWIGFLARNPAALLDLQLSVQRELAALCRWAAGSYKSLCMRLGQASLSNDAEGRMLLRRLEAPAGVELQASPPPASQLMDWLRIRPPELQ